eukprot:31378-Pelagococcus_subviridis.AAC.8
MPIAFDVDRPNSATSMRKEATERPCSYASVATSANSCAANREPRRTARNATWSRRISSSSEAADVDATSSSFDAAGARVAARRRRRRAAGSRKAAAATAIDAARAVAADAVIAIASGASRRGARVEE